MTSLQNPWNASRLYRLDVEKQSVERAAAQYRPEADELIVIAPGGQKHFAPSKPWASRLESQIAKKFEKIAHEKNAQWLDFRLTEGGALSILVLPPKISSFELHTLLRTGLAARMKSEQNDFVLDLGALADDGQARQVLSGYVALLQIQAWQPASYGKKATQKSDLPASRKLRVHSKLAAPEIDACVARAMREAEGLNAVRTLSELPPNLLRPASYAQAVEAWAKEWGVSFEFWGREELKQKNAGAFLAVTQADPNDAGGIVKLSYKPQNDRSKRVVLVGKGLCFDTGGYNIKTSHMYSMHRDMTGSAVALAVFKALADAKVDFPVEAYLALAENLVSPTAYRPNDVVVTSKGLSVEVVDTDAEGRMVLSDTLHLATEGGAKIVLDFATLTGAVIRALDTRRSGVFTRTEELIRLAEEAGIETGERVWPFPVGGDYEEALKSEIADLKQCSEEPNADHIYAASFLNKFVSEQADWIHMDLSASSHKGGLGLVESETTGFGVRWALEVIRRKTSLR